MNGPLRIFKKCRQYILKSYLLKLEKLKCDFMGILTPLCYYLLSQTTEQNLFSVTKRSDIFAHGISFLRLNSDQSLFSTILHVVNTRCKVNGLDFWFFFIKMLPDLEF